MIMAKNPEQYGLSGIIADAPVLSDTVTTSYAIDLRLVADLTGATVPEIVALNPALLRLSTPRDISYDLHVPPGTHDAFLDRLKDIPEDNRASWRFHIVKDGETLDEIAASLHARAAEIASYNDVTPSKPIEAGDELIVPVTGVTAAETGQQRYTPKATDTLITVADRFGVSVEQLRTWNHLSSNRVVPGHALYVTAPIRLAPGMRTSRGRAKTTSHRAASSHTAARSSRSNAAPSAPSRNTKSKSVATPATSRKTTPTPAKKPVH